ncbi:hypothetical protein EUTSA_v10002977mg [Eutrema salsugineum]|uniref:F-box domain-containing protein n=1 Tax=Eutrema salsugineum TaxID=72664 RepID=V4LBG3_EUTSA|nr:hypothetical protein EUTSA_v10002977mg [Eutrema salsugineum]
MTMISELPENLLEEILFRIPARSIKRLRSTCKRWKRLFKDKRFTISHFDKAPKQFLSFMLSESRLSLMHNNLHRFSPVKVTSELNLIDSHSGFDQIGIRQVFQCDGLLLCLTNESKTRIVVWNPCTGQTRWINHYKLDTTYALGSYQDKKSNDVSYKILACSCRGYVEQQEFNIFEMNSYSWKILDVPLDFQLNVFHYGVSLKGKTYWISRDEKEPSKMLLVTKIFERQSLPRKDSSYRTLSLSVFREEKLSVLSQCKVTSKIEIWVTNKFTETKTVSWSKVLPVDLDPGSEVWPGGSFLFDEEKKVLVCCDGLQYNKKATVYIFGEDNEVRKVDFKVESYLPYLFNYVPSLIQF